METAIVFFLNGLQMHLITNLVKGCNLSTKILEIMLMWK